MRSRRVGLAILLAVLVTGGLVGAACGGSSNNATATPQKTAPPAATSAKAAGATTAPTKAAGTTAAPQATSMAVGTLTAQQTSVTIKDYQFTPSTVTIKVGQIVGWGNSGPSTHTVTADDGSFDSGNIAQGMEWDKIFTKAGTFDYHCSIHPSMKGTVVVEP